MKLLRFCTAILVICMVSLTACAKTPTPTATTYTDDLGRQVTIAAIPQRIVSLSPSNTEILFALGEGSGSGGDRRLFALS